mmetsp:Transcript_2320/g.5497  ORF Transcript_2320/g.5497 Transcript_2320/m.5497 type:complete len:211 (+) Transcript_2320:89-721(+)
MAKEIQCSGALISVPFQTGAHETLAYFIQGVRDWRQLLRHRDLPQRSHDVLEGVVAPGLFGGGHFQDHATQAPYIRLAAVAIHLLNDLWRHPRYRTNCREGLRNCAPLRTPKVTQLDGEVQVHQNIRPLDVTMNHWGIPRVQVIQALKRAGRGTGQERVVQRPKLVEHPRHRTTGHIFQIDVQVVAGVLETQGLHDVGMAQVLADGKFGL